MLILTRPQQTMNIVTSVPLLVSLLCETSKCNLGADIGAKKDVYSEGMLIPSSVNKANNRYTGWLTVETREKQVFKTQACIRLKGNYTI